MASFVREVLSATGTLGEIGNFPGKIGKIQKKLQDLKSGLLVHIDSKYSKFSGQLNDAANLSSQMEELSSEIETLNNSINNHLKSQLGDCNKELLQLTQDIQELSLTLQVINRIKVCYDAIEDGNEFVREGKWLAASKTLAKSLEFVKNSDCGLEDEKIRILPVIKLEMVRQQQRILETVCKQWRDNVEMSRESADQCCLHIKFSGDKDDQVSEVVQSMFFSNLLTEQLTTFTNNLKQRFLKPIISSTCSIKIYGDTKKLTVRVQSKTAPDVKQVFSQLTEVFKFISIYLDVKLDEATSLMTLMSPILCSWLCDNLIRDVLAPAVPDSPDQLHTYQETVDNTEHFQEYLVNIGLMPQDNLTLLNYARNVDAIFASKLCQNLLSEAREIMKKDLFVTADVGPEEVAKAGSDDDEDDDSLALPPNFPLPETTFQFPACKISASVLELMELVTRSLEDASQAKSLCQVRLYHTVRGVFTLWCAVTPTYHSSLLSSLPQTAALAHNSAFYLAHQVITYLLFYFML